MKTVYLITALLISFFQGNALACAVCFGNPDSPMSRGVQMGVLFMIGVVGFVLTSIAVTGFIWFRRSKLITHK